MEKSLLVEEKRVLLAVVCPLAVCLPPAVGGHPPFSILPALLWSPAQYPLAREPLSAQPHPRFNYLQYRSTYFQGAPKRLSPNYVVGFASARVLITEEGRLEIQEASPGR